MPSRSSSPMEVTSSPGPSPAALQARLEPISLGHQARERRGAVAGSTVEGSGSMAEGSKWDYYFVP